MTADPAPGYPYGLTDPTTTLTVLTLISRAVAALMGTGTVLAIYLIAKEFFGRRAGLYAALTAAVCNTLIFYAHTTNVDMPYVFWSMWALWAFARLWTEGQRRHYVLLGVFVALAMASKVQAYALFLLLPVPIVWVHYHQSGSPRLNFESLIKVLLHRNIIGAALGFAMTFVLANNLVFNLPRYINMMREVIRDRDVDRYLDPTVLGDHFQLIGQTLDFLQRSMGWPLFLAGSVGLFYCLWRHSRRTWPLLVPLVSFYAVFIHVNLFYVHPRHVLPVALLLALFGGKLMADGLDSRRIPAVAMPVILTVVFGYSFIYGLSADLTIMNDSRYLAGDWMRANISKDAQVEVNSPLMFLPWNLDAYQVSYEAVNDDYLAGLKRRNPDVVILTEKLYRLNDDQLEADLFAKARHENVTLRTLLSGEAGYQLSAQFKYKFHDWFFPDMFYGQNPHIFIFEHVTP
jgi:asparagine N-glycosylation enzyme membrane subunit Stt3